MVRIFGFAAVMVTAALLRTAAAQNLTAGPPDTLHHLSQTADSMELEITFTATGFSGRATTYFYLSHDPVFSDAEFLLDSTDVSFSALPWVKRKTVRVPFRLNAGTYHVFYLLDADSAVAETDETDNLGHILIDAVPNAALPYEDTFEGTDLWTPAFTGGGGDVEATYWARGLSTVPRLEGTHSGSSSWYITQEPVSGNSSSSQLLASPYFSVPDDADSLYLCFWYRVRELVDPPHNIGVNLMRTDQFSMADYLQEWWYPLSPARVQLENPRNPGWDCACVNLDTLRGAENAFAQFYLYSYAHYSNYADHMNIDDIYIGRAGVDFSLEHRRTRRIPRSATTDTFRTELYNSGAAAAPGCTVRFTLSRDTIINAGDVALGTRQYGPLQSLASGTARVGYAIPDGWPDEYYILYEVDPGNAVAEMREWNNRGYYRIIRDTVMAFPYVNDFDTETDGWYHTAVRGTDCWEWSVPSGSLATAFGLTSRCFTNCADGEPASGSRMDLYTPAVDLSGATRPVLEFDMYNFFLKYYSSTSGYRYVRPGTNVSYSVDGGFNWELLDTCSRSYKGWYYSLDADYAGGPHTNLLDTPYERSMVSHSDWLGNNTGSVTDFKLDVSDLRGNDNVRFRFNYATAESVLTAGMTIDNFRITEGKPNLRAYRDRELTISAVNPELRFHIDVENAGNYTSDSTLIRFYYSEDELIDGSDKYLGLDTIPVIRPGFFTYRNVWFPNAGTPGNYRYLLYQIDYPGLVDESDETDNTGAWPLRTDPVASFPYLEDFSAVDPVGWSHWAKSGYKANFSHIKDKYRMRTRLGINEDTYAAPNGRRDGQMFGDKVPEYLYMDQYSRYCPFFHLISPSFDFRGLSDVVIAFELGLSAWDGVDGARMEYSLDGGVTFSPVTENLADSVEDWYNNDESLGYLAAGADGWTNPNYSFFYPKCRLSFLAGRTNVVFRFKHRAEELVTTNMKSIKGLRLDDFNVAERWEDLTDVHPRPAPERVCGTVPRVRIVTGSRLELVYAGAVAADIRALDGTLRVSAGAVRGGIGIPAYGRGMFLVTEYDGAGKPLTNYRMLLLR